MIFIVRLLIKAAYQGTMAVTRTRVCGIKLKVFKNWWHYKRSDSFRITELDKYITTVCYSAKSSCLHFPSQAP